jgi:hypothetical protein
LKWKGKPQFLITGELSVWDCEWDLSGVNNDDVDFVHFKLSGTLKCNNVLVNAYEKSSLMFLRNTSNNIHLSCEKFVFKGIKIDLSKRHFNFGGGEVNFTDSV